MNYIDINKLFEWDLNPRFINKKDFESLKKDLQSPIAKEFFEARPIIVSSRTGKYVIIAGNTRFKASKELGFKSVPVVILDNLTEEQEKEINVKDNTHRGQFDFDMIANHFDPIKFEEWGGFINGFDSEFDNQEGFYEENEESISEKVKEPKNAKEKQIEVEFNGFLDSVINIKDLEPRNDFLLSLSEFNNIENTAISFQSPAILEFILRLFCPENGNILEIEPLSEEMKCTCNFLNLNYSNNNKCHSLDIEKNYSNIDFIYFNYNKISENYNTELGYLQKLIRKVVLTLTNNRFFIIQIKELSDKSGRISPIIGEVMKFVENDESILYNHLIFYEDGQSKTKEINSKRKFRSEKTHTLCFYKGSTAKIKDIFSKII